jgi:TnpA family transposase
MVAARMVSKTWYTFIENQRGIWINLMRKCFEDIPKKAHQMSVRRADGTKIKILIAVMPEPRTIFGRPVNPIPTG